MHIDLTLELLVTFVEKCRGKLLLAGNMLSLGCSNLMAAFKCMPLTCWNDVPVA